MSKILVTGYAGFIGQHLIQALSKQDHTVYGIDIESGKGLKSGRSQKADARDFFAKDDQQDWGTVYHCAGIIGGRTKIDGAPLDLAVNLAIDADMIQWALRTKPKKLVLFSSSAAYPVELQAKPAVDSIGGEWIAEPYMERWRPLKESDIDLSVAHNSDALYGYSKVTLEKLAVLGKERGLDVLVLRPFSGYCGITQSLDYPFPSLVQRAMNHTNPFPIWGDPSSMRDWVHVSDVVGATLAAVENDVQGPVNICTGIGTRFDDLVRMMGAEVGYEPEIVGQSDKPMGVHTRVGDPALMKTFYEPRVSVEEGVHRAVEHFKSRES